MRFYLISSKRQSMFMDNYFCDDDGIFCSPEELFGKNVEFIMSRIYVDSPNWNFLFNYYISLYGKYVIFCASNDIIGIMFCTYIYMFIFSKPIYVYSCGSKSLNKDVRKACCKYNKHRFNFRFIHEAFS